MAQISVIVPVYGVEAYLCRCVDSILSQTFSDFELILVDDGSPDNCGAMCDDYAREEPRITVIHQKNGGLSAARNAGLDYVFAHSDSRWIYFADSDDWLHPSALAVLLAGAEATGCSVVIGGFARTQGENPEIEARKCTPELVDTQSFFCNQRTLAVCAWGKLYRRECFAQLRYPVGRIHEDEFTTYKILFNYEKTALIAQPLYAYFVNPDGITGSVWKPTRLHKADALMERAQWFRDRGNEAMYAQSLLACFYYLTVMDEEISACPQETAGVYRPAIRREIKALSKRIYRELPGSGRKKLAYYLLNWKLPGLMAGYRKITG